MFALGCVPIVNLFKQQCEPIRLGHTDTEYRIVPDARRAPNLEVWQVERVHETRSDGSVRRWRPFYRMTQGDREGDAAGAFYHVARRDGSAGGSEVYLAPYDPEFDPETPGGSVISVEALCTNRDLPAALPFGGGHPELRFVEPLAAVTRLSCVFAPTPPLRPPLRERRFWRLVSHLSLGHLSLVGGEQGAAALREVLQLYDLRGVAETRRPDRGQSDPGQRASAERALRRFLPRDRRATRI
jgi:type VI secretion system protein ImpG